MLAVDVGGTWVRAALISPDGQVGHRNTIPTPLADRGTDAIVRLACNVAALGRPTSCVFGVPGRVDYSRGELEYARNLPTSWITTLNERRLSKAIGLPVSLVKDADVATVGEGYFGAGIGYEDIVYVTLSTGVGAGALLGRRVVHGRRSMVEIGLTGLAISDTNTGAAAMPFHPVEDLVSGTAIANVARQAGLADDASTLADRVRAGDPASAAVWDGFASRVGLVLANLSHLFTPQVIVVGGGVSNAGDLMLASLQRSVADLGPEGLPSPIEVRLAQLADDSGLVGAAAWESAFTISSST